MQLNGAGQEAAADIALRGCRGLLRTTRWRSPMFTKSRYVRRSDSCSCDVQSTEAWLSDDSSGQEGWVGGRFAMGNIDGLGKRCSARGGPSGRRKKTCRHWKPPTPLKSLPPRPRLAGWADLDKVWGRLEVPGQVDVVGCAGQSRSNGVRKPVQRPVKGQAKEPAQGGRGGLSAK